MKKLKFVFCFILLTFIYIVGGNVNNIYAYTTINSQTLFTPSTFDTLVLNYTTLPTVSVSGSQAYHLGEGTTSSGAPTRGVYYDNASTGQTLDSTVTVNFSNCGTLLGRPIDMKLIYSDIVTNGDGPYLYWSAFGSQMMSSNEWWYQHIEHVDVDVYFYYHGETTPINIDTAYLSIFSEDTNEGSGSSQISEAYLYTTTNMAHVDNRTSVNGSRVYYDVYYGTTSGSTEAGSLNCVSFRYNNKDHLNIELYGLNYGTSIGYHLQYTPLTAVVPSNPVKTVSKTQAQLGDTLTYTVEQQISTRFDDSFHYSSLVFTDIIDKNLTYNSLRVYNENGNDVTSSAGTTSYDSTTQRLTYTFNTGYLQNNMNYNGQNYKFVISANVKHSVNSAIINNSSSVNINNQHELNSNTVTTTLKSKVNVHYVNMQGVKIAEDEVINGNILDTYSTSSKNINGYKLIRDTGNTQGTMTENEINVTYTYDIVRSSIQIDKTIEETNSTQKQNLAGAVFKAEVINFAQGVELAQPDTVYYSTQTDENGHCVIDGLPYGTYKITESTVPDIAYNGKFYLNDGTDVINTFNVEISQESSYEYSIEDVAKKMQIVIYKEDSETGSTTQGDAKLEGAEYTIYRDEQCNDAVETVTIAKNDDGTYSATSGWYMVGTYYVKETKAPEGYNIDEKVYPVVQVPSEQTEEFSTHTVVSKDEVIRNDIEIVKNIEETDSTQKQSLAGAIFSATLNSDTSKVYYSTQTDESGYCIIEDLPYGTYTVRESTIPDTAYNGEFYIDNSDQRQTTFEQFIELDDSTNEPYRYGDITNVAKKMQIVIYKEDSETGNITQGDAKLEGAEYTIYRDEQCSDAIETVTIQKDAQGKYSATSGWYMVGTYYVKETKAPEGYNIDEKVYPVVQVPSEQTEEFSTHTVVSKDEVIRNDIEIVKNIEETDSTQKQSLAGAIFSATLNSDTSKVYYSTQTDESGYCIIEDLPYGTYTVRESTIPDTAYNGEFYIDNSDQRQTTFEQFIELDDSTNEPYRYGDITDVAKKMQITIYKEDSETGNTTQGDAKLEGAEYTIYRDEQCSDAVETVTIAKNDDGTYSATSGWYMVGTYYVKETKAPEGYLIDEKVYPVVQVPSEQTEEFSTHTVLSKDKVIEGIVKVIKYNNSSSSTDEGPATGAVLRLTLNSNKDIYYEATVNEYGYLEFVDDSCKDTCYPYTIPYGKYTISEVKASDSGAHIFIEEQPTEIVYDKQIQEYILSDEYVRMSLTIEKYDGETGNKIPTGATFKIWDVNNNKWYEEMSYPSGEYISEFTTNSTGSLTLNRHLEAGRYILYETKAPEGYYLDDDLREGSAGYEFTVQVNKSGEVVVTHNGEEQVLEYEVVDYDNMPTKMYKYTAKVNDIPQKAIVEVEKLADQVVGVQEQDTEYGKLNTPQYDKKGLENVTFQLVAAEDIVTPDGTTRYNQGQVVSNIITNNQGIGRSQEVYLGKYLLKETSTQNGYVLNSEPIEINIEYTNQYEKVQIVKKQVENKKQEVNLEFEKIYKQLEESKFKFDETSAIFGVYTKTPMYGYDGSVVLGENQLVDILETDENNMLKNNIELPEGDYYVKELYVSNPYGLEDDTYEFKVEYTNTDNESIEVTVNNGKIENIAQTAELEMIKFSDVDYEKLNIDEINDKEKIRILASEYGVEGAVYKVYNDKECTRPVITIDNKEAEFITDENGTIKLSDMPYGTYYFKEVEAPYGYELSDEIIEVKINDENSNLGVFIVVNDPLKKADLLQKIDTFTKDVVSGCEFEIYNDDGRMIYSAKTDNNGKVQIPIIYFENGGKYYYKEVSAPKMYQVDEEAKEFIAKYDEEKCEWTLELIEVGNDRKTIEQVILRKTDRETGEPLQGCEFTIVLLDENGEEYVNQYGEKIYLVEKGVTNEEGEYVIKDVPYGTYRFVEIKAPEGYELDEDITGLEFTVDERSGDTLIFEVTNTGDIALVATVCIALISILGITYVVIKNKKQKQI